MMVGAMLMMPHATNEFRGGFWWGCWADEALAQPAVLKYGHRASAMPISFKR